jgi:hypothetical protein
MTSTSSIISLSALLVLLLPLVASQAVRPSSDVLPQVASPFNITYRISEMVGTAGVAPLTTEAGIGQSLIALNVCTNHPQPP